MMHLPGLHGMMHCADPQKGLRGLLPWFALLGYFPGKFSVKGGGFRGLGSMTKCKEMLLADPTAGSNWRTKQPKEVTAGEVRNCINSHFLVWVRPGPSADASHHLYMYNTP